MTPGWERPRRRITSAVVMGVGLLPVLECHHGHGRARRPLCRSSLWPLVSSLGGLVSSGLLALSMTGPAPSLLLPVRPRPTNSCLRLWASGAAVWKHLGIQIPCQCQVVAPTRIASLTALLLSISRTGAGQVGGLLWRPHRHRQAGTRCNGASLKSSSFQGAPKV